jgi:uncharacterized protein (UPF0332 family)
MSFDWLLYIKMTEKLLRRKPKGMEEAYLRTAISRAYYGIFGKLRQDLETRGIKFPGNRNIHQELIKKLKASSDALELQAGVQLDRLRRERNSADYDANAYFDQTRARKAKILAGEINQWLARDPGD